MGDEAAAAQASMATLRLQANEKFKAGELKGAAELYEAAAALRGVPGVQEGPAAQAEEAVKCYGNLCTVYQRLGDEAACLRAAEAATTLQPAYPKGLAFRGQITMAMAARRLSAAVSAEQVRITGPGAQEDEEAATRASRELDAALFDVMAAQRWVSAASLLAPTLAAQLETAHRQGAEAVAEYEALLDAAARLAEAKGAAGEAEGNASGPLVSTKSGSKFVTAGTGVIACRRLKLGQQLAFLERPICVGYYGEHAGRRLCVCCAAVEDPEAVASGAARAYFQCERCQSVCYCSEECAAEYAERHEEHECHNMRNLREMARRIEESQREAPAELIEVAMAAITALSAVRAGHVDAELLLSLDAHEDEVTHTLGPLVPLVCDLLAHEDRRKVQKACGITRCNAIQLSDKSGLGVGQAIFGGYASRFNHSCCPNAAIDVDARVIRTIRPIAEGEEVTISYTPQLYLPRTMRQQVLADRYFFTCRCPMCAPGSAPDSAAPIAAAADTIESLLSGTFAGARPDATEYYRGQAIGIAEHIRSIEVAEVDQGLLKDALEFMEKVGAECLATHFVLQELRNAAVFAASVLGDKALVARHAEEEAWLWDVLVPGALPVKCDKLRNWLLATESADTAEAAAASPTSEAGAPSKAAVKATLLRFYSRSA